jgi:hypothetical protein
VTSNVAQHIVRYVSSYVYLGWEGQHTKTEFWWEHFQKAQTSKTRPCEHGNERSGSIKGD